MAIVVTIWLGYLAWFVLLVARRVTDPGRRSTPPWRRAGELVLDGIALPVLMVAASMRGTQQPLLLAGAALISWTFARRYVASMVIPLAFVCVGIKGLVLARNYARGIPWASPYGLTGAGYGALATHLVLPQACAFVAAGLWLAWRRRDPDTPVTRLLLREPGAVPGERGRPRWGLLLLLVVGLLAEMLGTTFWLDTSWWNLGLTIAVGLVALALVFLAPKAAADLALAGLILLGLYGTALAAFWPAHIPLPSPFTDEVRFGAVWVASRTSALLAGAQGLGLAGLGLWLFPRAIDDRTRALFRSATDADLAVRVVRLARTRAEAVDTAAAEIRRLERDLHDGAQARLVALGMSLGAAEKLIPVNPTAAAALVAEARETSVRVLGELRDLVRGICPPVLADRGLSEAVRALALDTPLRLDVDIDLPGRPDLPVESACYFAVAEALTNAVKHSGAREAQIRIEYRDGKLAITIIDDGAGGADPSLGSGLLGLERRLGTFDGVLAISSPPGGPTIVAIEVPCALSSLKTSSC